MTVVLSVFLTPVITKFYTLEFFNKFLCLLRECLENLQILVVLDRSIKNTTIKVNLGILFLVFHFQGKIKIQMDEVHFKSHLVLIFN